jgi:hypothetical protein
MENCMLTVVFQRSRTSDDTQVHSIEHTDIEEEIPVCLVVKGDEE